MLVSRICRTLVVLLGALSLSSCLILYVESYESPTTPTGNSINLIEGDLQARPCSQAPADSVFTCFFSTNSGFSAAAIFKLLGLDLSIGSSLWLDPVILQVPLGISEISGELSGKGSGALSVVEVTGPLQADATRQITPEPGMKFVIIDFPGGVPPGGAGTYRFKLRFTTPSALPRPLQMKVMFAAKVTTGGQTFYPPLLPCTTSMGEVPVLTLPAAGMFSAPNLTPFLAQKGCNNATYNFAGGAVGPIVEVVEYRHAAFDHYFVTWRADEIALLDAGVVIKGWTRTGRTFKAYSSPQAGSSEVCRFYIPPALGDSHFFGRGATECADTATKFPALVLEDLQFMHLVLPTAGACPAGLVAVYRVFSNRADANHRYMTDRNVRDQMVAAGWLAEGDGPDQVVMCAPA